LTYRRLPGLRNSLCTSSSRYDWQNELYHQHLNYAKQHYSTIKARTNNILNCTGAPGYCWLLCLQYLCYLFNHMSNKSLHWKAPLQVTGAARDISILLMFTFYEPVVYTWYECKFPSESTEEKGFFVSFSDTVGDAFNFRIITSDTNCNIQRSNVRSACTHPNYRLMTDGEISGQADRLFIMSTNDNHTHAGDITPPLSGFSAPDLIGRAFLDAPDENGC
jgi:hypothetical protein